MGRTDFGIFLLCLFVYILLVVVFSILILQLIKLYLKVINSGIDDLNIKREYELRLSKIKTIDQMKIFDLQLTKERKPDKFSFLSVVANIFVWVCLLSLFFVAAYFSLGRNRAVKNIPLVKTVQSPSMARKNPRNKYLQENNLNNQIGIDDLVVLRKMPAESDLKLYDIVMYEREEEDQTLLILHRIVEITEDESGKKYKFQGDALSTFDNKPVTYSQMKGIYKNERVPYLGSFVKFLQSPAGYLCIILIICVAFAYPFLDKKLENAKEIRLRLMGYDVSILQIKKSKKIKKPKKT